MKGKKIRNYALAFVLCLGLHPGRVVAAENEQKVHSAITHVTVFLSQAQVTRLARVDLGPGITNIVFNQVSPYINLNSLQVKTEGNVTLMAVTHRRNFLREEEKPHMITDLEDSLQSIKWMLESVNNKKQTYQFEREVMIANKSIGGTQTGLKADELEDALALFRKKMNEVNDETMKLHQQERRLNEIRTRLEKQLNELRAGLNINAPEIIITIKTLAAVSHAKIELSYIVSNASWVPFYDIRVKDTKSQLQLVSKAYITQATGEEWKNVILKLSTSNTNEGGVKPELQPNFLTFEMQQVTELQSASYGKRKAPAADGYSNDMKTSPGVATVQQGEVSVEFNVASAYSIPSDNTPHQVDLTVSNLDAVYAYSASPKLDKDAFVTARVSGNDLVNQVSGEANVYFDGTFVGKTFINGTTSDSLLISLGRDKRIQIQRQKLKDYCTRTFTGSMKKELTTWEISMRNTRKEAVTLVLEDQIPVSTNKEIEVKLQSSDGAQFDEATGKLVWVLRLEPEQSHTVKFSFEVKFPKDKRITEY